MFDSLDEQMARDDAQESTKKERMIRYAVIAVSSVVLFVGLVLGVGYFS
jgi:hypothetical protein